MAFTKSVTLKVLLGIGAFGGTMGGMAYYVRGDSELGIPRKCNLASTCELNEKQMNKIKFETNGNNPISMEGMSKEDRVTLNIIRDRKYRFSVKKEGIKIKGVKDGDVELGKEEIEFIVDKGLLKKVAVSNKLGLPVECKVNEVNSTTSKECKLTKEQLEKVKFGVKENGAIEVTGLEGNKTVTLTISHESNATTYPNNRKYTFKLTEEGNMKIKGIKDEEVDIGKDKGVYFKESSDGNRLDKVEGD